MRQSTRLILNTGATYLRMALTVGIGLLATRWAREALGAVDFDIWLALTLSVGVLLILPEGISGPIERFMAYEIGRGDPHRQRRIFGTALVVMLVIAALALLIGLPLGKFIVSVTFDTERGIQSAREHHGLLIWAYGMVLAGLCLQIFATPFRSMFAAHQSFALLTLIDTLDSILKLAAVVIAGRAPHGSDRLLWLCALLLAGQAVTAGALAVFCLLTYRESRAGILSFSTATLRELASFTGWSVLGTVSYRIRISSPPMLLTAAFGESLAGAYGLAAQAAGYQLNLSSAVGKAARPAVSQAAGRQELHRVRQLIPAINKYASLMALYYLIPLSIETDAVLRLWMGTDPDGTPHYHPMAPLFVRLMLFIMGLPWVYMGYDAAIMADGRIKHYMISAVVIELIGLGIIALAVLLLGAPAWAVPAIGLGVGLFAVCYWVVHISGLLSIPLSEWFTLTWRPILIVALPATGAALLPRLVMDAGPWRALAALIAYAAVATPLTWAFAVSDAERSHFVRVLGAVWSKVRPPRA